MKKMLVTGGTVFVSKFIANYFKNKYEVYVLNRNTRSQLEGVHLIEADRNHLDNKLKHYHFQIVIDVNAYTETDIKNLYSHLNKVKDYIFISSSAVYPKTNKQPFIEEQKTGYNCVWKDYGLNKLEAEQCLLRMNPNAYILRPAYIYGPMQNIYREPFVFECANKNRPFLIPKNGEMKLQFIHVEDLCKIIEKILEIHPQNHIFNIGNEQVVTINEFVQLCYKVANKKLDAINVYHQHNQRDYFPFYDYEYVLDITKQKELLNHTKNLYEGLKESYDYYMEHQNDVVKKPYIQYIDNYLIDK
jgi:dTDP-glucose 4,6-dehydratase